MVFGVQKGGFCIAKVWFLFFECCVVAICLECYHNPFVMFWQSVSNVLAIRQQHYRNPSAAVGARFIAPAYTYSPRIRNSFRMHSRNVRNVFVICVLHIRRVKVWFLRCKSMVFGVQKGGFCRARNRFLHCKSMVFVF